MSRLKDGPLSLSWAQEEDAPLLNAWWNDGAVMAHAGFPDGLGQPLADTLRTISSCLGSKDSGLWIVRYDGIPIGESAWQTVDENTARCGWKICDASYQNRGIGPRLIGLTLNWLLNDVALQAHHPFEAVVWDTNSNNTRAQQVYEHKIGAQRLGIRENCWQDQRGQWQSAVDYRITRDQLQNFKPVQ